MLKTRDSDLWGMRMEQYLTHTDYALWEVIMNGDAPVVASASTDGPIPPKTAEQKIARKNELKAKSTLLLAIPDEHLLKFHVIKDAKSLWEAIKTRFGGNKESKKMQKIVLKQQYENFTTSRSEGLDKIYDRFQKIISQLEIHGEVITQKDANMKLLRRLPSAWNNIALIMRNKPDLEELSMDDLYNNLKVYEAEIKSQSSSNLNSHNVAFVSSENTSSTNKAVNIALDVSTTSTQGQASSLTYVDDVKFFLNLNLNGKEAVGLDITNVEYYNCYRKRHFAKDCRAPRNQGNRNGDNARRVVPVETSANALVIQDGIASSSSSSSDSEVSTCSKACLKSYESLKEHFDKQKEQLKKSNLEIIGYQLGLESLEAKIVVHEKNEASYEKSIAFLKYDVQVKYISIKNLKNQLEEALKEKDDLKLKLENFEESSKNLTKLINSQISVKDKTGLGFDSHVNESEVIDNVVDSHECNQVNDRFKKSEGYHAVPLPFTGKFKPAKADLSFTGKDSLEKPKTVRFSAPIIEDWESDSEDENVFEPNEMVQKPVLNNVKKGIGQREVRQVWNNAMRVNHQNFSNSIWDFAPTAVLTKSGIVPISATRQSSSRAAAPASAARPVNTAAPKPFMNVNSVNIAKGNKVTSAIGEQGINAIKSSACWIWRPKGNVINHISKDSRSYMPKRFDYVDPQGRLKHMTGNKFYLSDYQDIDGGFVVFGGSSRGGKITGKRFSWVFFLATKDETPEILKNFITGIENQSDHKVKTIRSDNGTEFKNRIMNEFCEMKGIRREFSVARTSQQNGRKPALNFMRPFGCPVTILNTLDHVGKFDGKSDNGFFVGYSINSKAFRSSKDEIADDAGKKNGVEDPAKEDDINGPGEATNTNSTNRLNTISLPVNTVSSSFTTMDPGRARDQMNEFESVFGQDKDANSTYRIFTPISAAESSYENLGGSTPVNAATPSNADYPTDSLMPDLEDTADLQDTGTFGNAYDDEDVATQTRRMIKMYEEHAMISYINKQRRTNHKDYQNCLFACFLSQMEPKKVIQALADSSWVEAMQEELLQFRLQKVWRLVDLPKGKHAIGTK
ncbi:ribonuclease H-like domain-containing protein [Tanacetum coccineum]|uniref:Ribonuclease H-like domain-containing protein n=1 Tax=Tanacetum coccineum TaxID=301880 RepID=A0ABQ5GHJ6_9ASTR